MFCRKCGNTLATSQTHCSCCGTVCELAEVQIVNQRRSGSSSRVQVQVSVLIGVVLSVFAMLTLHPYAATLAVFGITACGFSLFSRRISTRHKVYVIAFAVCLTFVANTVEDWRERVESRKQAEARAAQEKQRVEEERKQEEAFKALSPAEHFSRLKSLLTVNSASQSVTEALKHLAAIPPNTLEAAEAAIIKRQYDASKRQQQQEAAKAQAVSAKKQAAEAAAVNRVLRDTMAKTFENNLLDKGYNVDVAAIGKDHTTLHIKWVLVSKVLAHQLSQQADFFDNARKIGFKRVEITDGYEETWYWKLDK